MIYEHVAEFCGRPVRLWEAGTPIDPAQEAARLALDYDAEGSWPDLLDAYLSTPSAADTEVLVVGMWFSGDDFGTNEPAQRAVEALVAARDRLPRLKALFFGDIVSEESEISWIENTDLSPLLSAFPLLEEFRVRGGNGLQIGSGLALPGLRRLVIETGGLDANVVRQVGAASLPALEHLELWIGEDAYGRTTGVEELAALLAPGAWPALRSLALRNAEIADDIAALVASAEIAERLDVLDLSLGTLSDTGAEAILASTRLGRLRKLDIHHHYCTRSLVKALGKRFPEVDHSDPQKEEEYGRFIFVGE